MSLRVLIKQKMKLQCHDLTPAQKKLLWEVMGRYGAKPGFSYRRFFKEGFKDWELRGVENVKSDFIKLHPQVSELMGKDSISFYQAVVTAGLWKIFLSYMSGLGMGRNQTGDKFGKKGETPFLEYEKVGVIAIYKEFISEIRRRNVI